MPTWSVDPLTGQAITSTIRGEPNPATASNPAGAIGSSSVSSGSGASTLISYYQQTHPGAQPQTFIYSDAGGTFSGTMAGGTHAMSGYIVTTTDTQGNTVTLPVSRGFAEKVQAMTGGTGYYSWTETVPVTTTAPPVVFGGGKTGGAGAEVGPTGKAHVIAQVPDAKTIAAQLELIRLQREGPYKTFAALALLPFVRPELAGPEIAGLLIPSERPKVNLQIGAALADIRTKGLYAQAIESEKNVAKAAAIGLLFGGISGEITTEAAAGMITPLAASTARLVLWGAGATIVGSQLIIPVASKDWWRVAQVAGALGIFTPVVIAGADIGYAITAPRLGPTIGTQQAEIRAKVGDVTSGKTVGKLETPVLTPEGKPVNVIRTEYGGTFKTFGTNMEQQTNVWLTSRSTLGSSVIESAQVSYVKTFVSGEPEFPTFRSYSLSIAGGEPVVSAMLGKVTITAVQPEALFPTLGVSTSKFMSVSTSAGTEVGIIGTTRGASPVVIGFEISAGKEIAYKATIVTKPSGTTMPSIKDLVAPLEGVVAKVEPTVETPKSSLTVSDISSAPAITQAAAGAHVKAINVALAQPKTPVVYTTGEFSLKIQPTGEFNLKIAGGEFNVKFPTLKDFKVGGVDIKNWKPGMGETTKWQQGQLNIDLTALKSGTKTGTKAQQRQMMKVGQATAKAQMQLPKQQQITSTGTASQQAEMQITEQKTAALQETALLVVPVTPVTTPRVKVIVPPSIPPIVPSSTGLVRKIGRRKVSRRFPKFGRLPGMKQTLMPDILSVNVSKLRFHGRATAPRPTKSLWERARRSLYISPTPTVELMKGRTSRPKRKERSLL